MDLHVGYVKSEITQWPDQCFLFHFCNVALFWQFILAEFQELEFKECDWIDWRHYKKVLIVLVINVCLSAMASLPCLNCMCENATVKLSVFTVRLAVLGKGTCLSGQLQFNCLPNVCGDLKSILHMKYQVVMFEE